MVFTAQQQIARYVQEQEELASIHTVPLATVRGTGLARGTGPAIISTGPPSRTFVNAYPQYPASDSIELLAAPKLATNDIVWSMVGAPFPMTVPARPCFNPHLPRTCDFREE
ncbi:hypothetical protein T484DRAFT_3187842 [Baffinella frigidus]|nr:hypothetical protein T484DRAFT_3187842 [Cryptophyta sp. CCMP2293]